LRRYIEILTSDPRHDVLNLTLVDGFAGGGEYLSASGIQPGSPLILLEQVALAQTRFNEERRKPFALKADFFFVEQNRSNFEYLSRVIGSSPYAAALRDKIYAVNEDFIAELPRILEHIRNRGRAHRSIFFLDQYGYGDVPFEAIRRILDLENPEIILTFSVDYLINYLNENEAFLKAVLPVELSVRQVQEMLGFKVQKEARWLIQNFLYRHLMKSTGAPFYTCFFIKSPESHRSYWLVHISKHPRARDEMARLHWSMSNHFIHHGRSGLRMLGFDPDQVIEQVPLDFMFDDDAEARSKEALLSELPSLIFSPSELGTRPVTVGQLFKRVCNETPATTLLISDALVKLRAEREIEILSKEGRPRPRSQQLDWADLILPARQITMFGPTSRRT
jgi:three-Cys-motif partner protein